MKLTADRLSAARGGEVVAGPVDISLAAGEALVVTGENGAGKSTLLRTIAGLLAPAAGTISIEGALAADGEPARHVGEAAHYLGHRNAMKGSLTVGANLLFWAGHLGGSGGIGIEDALEAVGLPTVARLPFSYLSAGQQRRAAIARLVVARRPVWILDEPTAALDAASQALFAGLLSDHCRSGGIVIAATHQPLGFAGQSLVLEGRAAVRQGQIAPDALAAAEGWL